MKNQSFERELPAKYKQVFYINAKNTRVGVIMNLAALVIIAAVVALAVIPIAGKVAWGEVLLESRTLLAYLVFLAAMVLYIVLHELVHGIAYAALTKETPTFGISLTCAFCGVPNIYTYRRAALIAIVSPLLVFSLIFGGLTAYLYFVNPFYYLLSAILLGLHLGGCIGDIYIMSLLLFKYKDKKTLIKDTGAEQYVFVPEESAE